MTPYKNVSGASNVVAYEFGDDYITVEFRNGPIRFYKYTYASAGTANIEHMKSLAERGQGLNSFINTRVKKDYESKW